LKRRHNGLTEEQLKVDMIGQFSKITIGEWHRSKGLAWS
jgi:hypothetical protein